MFLGTTAFPNLWLSPGGSFCHCGVALNPGRPENIWTLKLPPNRNRANVTQSHCEERGAGVAIQGFCQRPGPAWPPWCGGTIGEESHFQPGWCRDLQEQDVLNICCTFGSSEWTVSSQRCHKYSVWLSRQKNQHKKPASLSWEGPAGSPRLGLTDIYKGNYIQLAHNSMDTQVTGRWERSGKLLTCHSQSVFLWGHRDSGARPAACSWGPVCYWPLISLLWEWSLWKLTELEDMKSSEQPLAQNKYFVSGSYCYYSLKPRASSEKARWSILGKHGYFLTNLWDANRNTRQHWAGPLETTGLWGMGFPRQIAFLPALALACRRNLLFQLCQSKAF